jgi:hypothetical protein
MDKLTETTTIDTGLKHKGRDITIALEPSRKGGSLVFRTGSKTRKIPLAQILANIVEKRPPDVCAADWVELGGLESRVAINACEVGDGENDHKIAHLAKTLLWNLVRDARDERREDRGQAPVSWGKRRAAEEGEA